MKIASSETVKGKRERPCGETRSGSEAPAAILSIAERVYA
jgi:hypothetical protein